MQKTKHIFAIATLVLALLLISSPLIAIGALGASASVNQAADYGDVMQYECPQLGQDESNTRFSAGPAPDKPELLWAAPGTIHAVFNGKAFAIAGGFLTPGWLYALDALNGTEIWSTLLTHGGSAVTKLDDTYLLVDADTGLACYRIDDGTEAWFVPTDFTTKNIPASGNYFPGKYSSEMKMKYTSNYSRTTHQAKILAYNLSDPSSAPSIEWEYIMDESCEVLAVGDGIVFVGGYSSYSITALDGRNGELLWKMPKTGLPGYSATYYDGKLYHAPASTRLTCYDGEKGTILWDYDAGAGRAFFAYGGAVAYGRYYEHNIDPWGGFVGCWDIETGDVIWRAEPAYYQLGYFTPVVADGKVYVTRSDGWVGAGRVPDPACFACFDAFSGTKLWELPFTVTHPIVAYGKLYAGSYCIGPSDPPKPWSSFRGNLDNHGVAIGQPGPSNISCPKWIYETDGAVISSAAVVDGKVYIGSCDQNLYCLDAYNGSLIWKFPTEYRIASSPAVADGKVYLGPDDGYIYCLDADNGTELWKKDLYAGNIPPYLWEVSTWQARSSPIVVGGGLYVGALDGNFYCLNKENGNPLWTFPTGGPIGGSPAYADGVIYIASTDRNVYALDASNGNKIWNWTTPKTFEYQHPIWGWMNETVFGKSALFLVSTPTIAEGKVFIGGGAAYSGGMFMVPSILFAAINATDGTSIWEVDLQGNNAPVWTPTYVDGVLYAPEWMSLAAYNATDGSIIWNQWLGHQVFSSVAYADDMRGAKLYVGADSYSITCFNTTGTPISVYGTDGQVVGSPALYDGKLYVGSVDHDVYCFDDAPVVSTEIWAESSKGAEMWTNETVVIGGKLHPEIPDATILVTFTKPDQTQEDITTTTNLRGYFSASYTPTVDGNWSWTAWYEGVDLGSHSYSYAYTDDMPLKVVSPGEEPTNGEEPPPEGIPMEYIYAIVAVIAIIIIAVAAYVYMKRGKK